MCSDLSRSLRVRPAIDDNRCSLGHPLGELPRDDIGTRILGWTATDVFGLHATAPGPAVRCYGLAMLPDDGTVTELTAEGARIVRPGTSLHMTRGTGCAAVPAWDVATWARLDCGVLDPPEPTEASRYG